jgi:hypothetical protein
VFNKNVRDSFGVGIHGTKFSHFSFSLANRRIWFYAPGVFKLCARGKESITSAQKKKTEVCIDIRKQGFLTYALFTSIHPGELPWWCSGWGFKTRPRRWIFKGDKNPQHTFLSDGK